MREIRTQIDIKAPADKVWQVLTDFSGWQNWNPIVSDASGEAEVDSKVTVTMAGPNGKEHSYHPVITEINKPFQMRWRAKMGAGFIMTNDKLCKLEADGNNTRLVHSELFSGLMVPLMWGKLNQGVPGMLNKMNEALKELAEK